MYCGVFKPVRVGGCGAGVLSLDGPATGSGLIGVDMPGGLETERMRGGTAGGGIPFEWDSFLTLDEVV